MRKRLVLAVVVVMVLAQLSILQMRPLIEGPEVPTPQLVSQTPDALVPDEALVEKIEGLGCYFTENLGQFENGAGLYYASGYPLSVAFGKGWVAYYLRDIDDIENPSSVGYLIEFEGANIVEPQSDGSLEHRSNYFIGNDPDRWVSGARNFREIIYNDLYDGIDLRYYFEDGELKYDFDLEPKIDPSVIKIRFVGVEGLSIDGPTGDLYIETGLGVIEDSKPIAFQPNVEGRSTIPCSYWLIDDGLVGFKLDEYDRDKPLIIDPIISFSTFIGGGGEDHGLRMIVDDNGDIYLNGYTSSGIFPTTPGAHDTQRDGSFDGYLLKLNSDGTSLIFSTVIGGSGADFWGGIYLADNNKIYASGQTGSIDFPTTVGAYDRVYNGGDDIYVVRFNEDCSILEYGTFVGGSAHEAAGNIYVDSAGSMYVHGTSDSADFPISANAWDDSKDGFREGIVFKINANGQSLDFATFVGGTGNDYIYRMHVDSSSNVYVMGDTSSIDFPTEPGSYDTSPNGNTDVFVVKLYPDGSDAYFSTYFGGPGQDTLANYCLDEEGNFYLYGNTKSPNLPVTSKAFDSTLDGIDDDFIVKFDPDFSTVLYCTYIGGSGTEAWRWHEGGLTVTEDDIIYIAATTASTDFPITTNAIQSTQGGSYDTFLLIFKENTDYPIFSTYIGGVGMDNCYDMTLFESRWLYMTGTTFSPNFPTTAGVIDRVYSGAHEIFVLKIDLYGTPTPGVALVPGPAAWDSLGNGFPSLLEDEGVYKMWYSGHYSNVGSVKIGYAVSLDGENWAKPFDQPVLDVDPSLWWCKREIGYCSVIKEGEIYRMWFASSEGGIRYHIGYAESNDGINWIKHQAPLLSPGPSGAWDSSSVYGPLVVERAGTYYMWYIGWAGPNQIGLATSTDGFNWVKHPSNPVVRPGPGTPDLSAVTTHGVIKDNGLFRMFVTGYGPGVLPTTYMATSFDGVIWDKNYENVVLTSTGVPGDFDEYAGEVYGIQEDSLLRMWFNGFSTTPVKWSIGYKEIESTLLWNPTSDPGQGQTVYLGTPVALDGSGSFDIDGQIVSYDWDFGDGTPHGTDVTLVHLYSDLGTYQVTLTVTDNDGKTGTGIMYIVVLDNHPIADAGSDQDVYVGATVTFDGSGSLVADGTTVTYQWNFGDESTNGTGVTTTHIYQEIGTYTVTLTVTDNNGAEDTNTCVITVLNNPPISDPGSNQTAQQGGTVTFNGSGSADIDGTIVSYDWDFGDGTPHGTGETPSHQYADDGTYTVTLTVTDNDGGTSTSTGTITVLNDPPVAVAGADIILMVGESGSFDGTSSYDGDGSIVSYNWDFGDSSTHGSGSEVTHSYSINDTYTVILVVTDDDGDTGTDTLTVTVLTPCQALDILIEMVEDMNLDNGINNSLDSKLENAKKALDCLSNDQGPDAINKLEAFINEVEAQRDKKLTEEQSDILADYAQWIIDNI